MTSAFKGGTVGCDGQFVFPGFEGCGNVSAVSTSIFVLYSNDLPSETLSLTSTSRILCL